MFYADYWQPVKDGNPQAAELYSRHYSAHQYRDGRRQRYNYRNRNLIVGPGYKLVLLGKNATALCAWRRFQDATHQQGISCTVLRNESTELGSEMLLEAECWALRYWPDAWRFYTFIDPTKVLGNPPGNVFHRAGWSDVGRTKGGLIILAKQVRRFMSAQRAAATLILEYELPATPQPPAALASRLAAVGCELHHDPRTSHYGYHSEWRLDGLKDGPALFKDLDGVEDWLKRVVPAEALEEMAA